MNYENIFFFCNLFLIGDKNELHQQFLAVEEVKVIGEIFTCVT